jgi:hypothetical protein
VKTKIQTIYISDSGLKILQEKTPNALVQTLEFRFCEANRFKHPLVVNIPEEEKKITISESDVDNAFNSIRYLERHEDNLCPYTVRWLKDKLFEEK